MADTGRHQSKKANFDATHELEELLLEDNPLKARKRNPNVDISQLSDDLRTMEENFTVYDYTKQPRRNHFTTKGLKDHGTITQTSSQTATANHPTYEDQPLAEVASTPQTPLARSNNPMDEKAHTSAAHPHGG